MPNYRISLPFSGIVGKTFLLLLFCLTSAPAQVRLVFDTDMGNDIDDALALALIHALQNLGEAKLLGVTVSKDNRFAAPYVDILNTFYGRPNVAIGTVRNGKTPEDGNYLRQISQGGLYPHRFVDGRFAPDSVTVLRRILTAEKNGAVVIVQTGFCTNIARLLRSPPDDISSLSGRELVARKVRLISLMGGNFTDRRGGEYNIATDLESARILFAECPVPIVVSGYEVGRRILYPATSIQRDFNYVPHHPVSEAYRLYNRMPYDRPTWDLTSVLYAVRPDSFRISRPGRITILDQGQTAFTPRAHGTHRYLRMTEQQCQGALDAMTKLVPMSPRSK